LNGKQDDSMASIGTNENLIDRVIREAELEVNAEVVTKYKEKLKRKMKELSSAEKVVANIRRELEEIKLEIKQDLIDNGK
jgi:hypothetical protein